MKTRPGHKQNGAIFLLLVLILFVTGSTLVIGALNNRQSAALARDREVLFQMVQAKEALLAYAANYAKFYDNERGPGFFPCPDTDAPRVDEFGLPNYTNAAEEECTYDTPATGRLPKSESLSTTSFHFNESFAGIDQQFWYVAAPRYLYSDVTTDRRGYLRAYADSSMSTVASDYWLTLDGETGYVALIIAPGEELATQNRSAGPTDRTNYLDGLNGSDGFNFYTSYSNNPQLFNDRIIGITLDEYLVHVGTAIAQEVKLRLDEYYDDSLPSWPFYSKYYPADNTPVNPPGPTCNTSTFSNLFDGTTYGEAIPWLRAGSGNNGERWSCAQSLYWNRDSFPNRDKGTLKFNGCEGLSFRIEYGNDLKREGDGC